MGAKRRLNDDTIGRMEKKKFFGTKQRVEWLIHLSALRRRWQCGEERDNPRFAPLEHITVFFARCHGLLLSLADLLLCSWFVVSGPSGKRWKKEKRRRKKRKKIGRKEEERERSGKKRGSSTHSALQLSWIPEGDTYTFFVVSSLSKRGPEEVPRMPCTYVSNRTSRVTFVLSTCVPAPPTRLFFRVEKEKEPARRKRRKVSGGHSGGFLFLVVLSSSSSTALLLLLFLLLLFHLLLFAFSCHHESQQTGVVKDHTEGLPEREKLPVERQRTRNRKRDREGTWWGKSEEVGECFFAIVQRASRTRKALLTTSKRALDITVGVRGIQRVPLHPPDTSFLLVFFYLRCK